METAPPAGPAHALVVDEDPKIVALVEALLLDANFKVTLGHRAWDALLLMGLLDAKAPQKPLVPDLLVLDYTLPDRKGHEVVGCLRQGDHTQKVPVILLAKKGVDVPESVQLDVSVCLRKPFEIDAFLNAVIKALRLG